MQKIIYQQKVSTSTKYTSDSSIQAGSPVSDSDGDSYKEIEGVKPPISYLGLFLRIWREALVVLCVFFVTLSLFPSMTAEIETTSSISQAWFSILYVVSFLFFTLFFLLICFFLYSYSLFVFVVYLFLFLFCFVVFFFCYVIVILAYPFISFLAS